MKVAVLVESLFALLLARIATRTMRFITVARAMGWSPGQASAEISDLDLVRAREVKDAIAAALRVLRFEEPCLAESIAAKWMLGRRGVASTLCLGARIRGSAAHAPKLELDKHVALHAWLEAGDLIVTRDMTDHHGTISRYR